ncbi:MAG: SDR family NAD(P)-dependent oxidoreductase, partial [Pseudomonadota bacterium]|nr:SDR family NAD(P)-dependent oxidoreductase [Pseudomonadota bacterium]
MLSLGLLKDKVAIVTGASQGLGEQFAKVMAKNGAKVAIAARQRKKLEVLKEELEASKLESVVIEMDVLDQESIKQGIAKVEELWGIPDILVNNA